MDSNVVAKPILQAVLWWLAELIATKSLRDERVTRKDPQSDRVIAARMMRDIAAQAQTVIEQEHADLIRVTVGLARTLILTMSVVVRMGTQ